MAAKIKTITWTDKHEELARKVVEKHADKMRLNDILPFTTSGNTGGERRENQSGAVLFALMIAAGEVEVEK